LSYAGFLRQKEEINLVRKTIFDLKIRMPSISAFISTLSGGNQQKVVLGKWLGTNPKILILDDPTRGIDVGAKAEIREIIDRLAAEGRGVILISSELPEIIAMSDRTLVMREGRIAGEFYKDECSEEALGSCAISKRNSGGKLNAQ
jgi:ABC-type sugar transport system ATPase subunit